MIAPQEERLPPESLVRLKHTSGLIIVCKSMILLVDAVGLDVPDAKIAMLNAAR